MEIDLSHRRVAIVLGIDHKIQHTLENIPIDDMRNIMRLHFRDYLIELTGGCPGISVICEEAKHGGTQSIAESVARREGMGYCNIEMPPGRRAELGIPALYTIDMPGSEIPLQQKSEWNTLREAYMIQEVIAKIGDARAAIVICGVSHMEALTKTLRAYFKEVYNYDVTTLNWFNNSLL